MKYNFRKRGDGEEEIGELLVSLSRKLFFSKDVVENHYSLTPSESQVINILRTSMIIFVVYEHSLNF